MKVIAKCLKIVNSPSNVNAKFVEIFEIMVAATCSLKQHGFTTYVVESHRACRHYQGRDTYHKMLLISGVGEIEYGNTSYLFNGSVLVFTKPGVRCRWFLSEAHDPTYICAFNSDFVDSECLSWNEYCEHYFETAPVLRLSSEQETFVRAIFCRMIEEQSKSYVFKEELMQNQLCILKHMALRMKPAKESLSKMARTSPSCCVSLELVELGFPLAAQSLHFN